MLYQTAGTAASWVALHPPASRIKARKYMSTVLLLIDEMGYDPMNREEAILFTSASGTALQRRL